jgi:cysteine desulfurase
MRRIYLDYAATTPVDARVFRAMRPYFSLVFGNPGSPHAEGREAFDALMRSRETLAKFFGVPPAGVIFTASATEANNLAIRGVVMRARAAVRVPHILTTAIEHDSVLEVCRALEREGAAAVTYVGVDRDGLVDPEGIRRALRPETVLVSVMYANNEIGTIQPIRAISDVVRKWRGEHRPSYPLFHTDAAQAVQYLDCDVGRLGVDMMTVSSHKIYGPKGIAALIVGGGEDGRAMLAPILVGGGQEGGLRSGTENVPAIVGFGAAIALIVREGERECVRIRILRDRFLERILAIDPAIRLNGSREHRLPSNVNLSFPGAPSDVMLTMLDRLGIAASSGSACDAHAAKPSHVLEAIGLEEELRESAIRFTLGRFTTARELERAAGIIASVYAKIRGSIRTAPLGYGGAPPRGSGERARP